jgi:hypothetical protein
LNALPRRTSGGQGHDRGFAVSGVEQTIVGPVMVLIGWALAEN